LSPQARWSKAFPYISLDRRGRFLFGASYGANLISVNSVGADGRIGDPVQVVPTARNAHSIRPDNSNRFVFAPHLGTRKTTSVAAQQETVLSCRDRRRRRFLLPWTRSIFLRSPRTPFRLAFPGWTMSCGGLDAPSATAPRQVSSKRRHSSTL
jgi:hypothetical protein